MIDESRLYAKAFEYCQSTGRELLKEAKLGHGTDGSVWSTRSDTAVKAFHWEKAYANEVASYERLAELELSTLHGLHIPRFYGHDHDLLVIEMTIVQPPFLLDFGKAYVDRPRRTGATPS